MLVKAKTKSGETIQIYDPEYLNDLDLKDFGMSDIEEITELDTDFPIYPLTDIILSQITKKSTISQKLENLGILNCGDLSIEKARISKKISKLSRSQRELVTQRYNDVLDILGDPKNGTDPAKQDKQPESGNSDSTGSGGDMV